MSPGSAKKRRRAAWVVSTVLVAAALVATARYVIEKHPPRRPRLVVLYATCTLNRMFLSPYDPSVSYTPFLAEFARGGLVFTKHQTEEAQTGIAFASLFSGSDATRHGVYSHPAPIDDAVYLIAEAYRDAGYETFFWADHPMASPELGYARGVEQANTFWNEEAASAPEAEEFLRADDPRFGRILERLRADPSYRALILTSFSVTHAPYSDAYVGEFCRFYPAECAGVAAPVIHDRAQEFRRDYLEWQYAYDSLASRMPAADLATMGRVLEILYKANVFHLDRLFGALVGTIASRGLLEESLIAFTADHGEMLDRRNAPIKWTHGFALAPEDIVVPLIIRGPGVRLGRFDSVSRSIDVFPTLAGLSGVSVPSGTVMGVDLAGAIRGDEPVPALLAFSHTSLPVPFLNRPVFRTLTRRFPSADPGVMWVAVRDGDMVYKLTSEDGRAFQPDVYDWAADPGETRDLYDATNERHRSMLKRLYDYKRGLRDAYRTRPAARAKPPTAQELERVKELLRNLGYIQ